MVSMAIILFKIGDQHKRPDIFPAADTGKTKAKKSDPVKNPGRF